MNQPAEIPAFAALPEGTYAEPEQMWQAIVDRQAAKEALLIQCIGEIGRGLLILDKELKHGQFNHARTSVAILLTVVQTADALIAGAGG